MVKVKSRTIHDLRVKMGESLTARLAAGERPTAAEIAKQFKAKNSRLVGELARALVDRALIKLVGEAREQRFGLQDTAQLTFLEPYIGAPRSLAVEDGGRKVTASVLKMTVEELTAYLDQPAPQAKSRRNKYPALVRMERDLLARKIDGSVSVEDGLRSLAERGQN